MRSFNKLEMMGGERSGANRSAPPLQTILNIFSTVLLLLPDGSVTAQLSSDLVAFELIPSNDSIK